MAMDFGVTSNFFFKVSQNGAPPRSGTGVYDDSQSTRKLKDLTRTMFTILFLDMHWGVT